MPCTVRQVLMVSKKYYGHPEKRLYKTCLLLWNTDRTFHCITANQGKIRRPTNTIEQGSKFTPIITHPGMMWGCFSGRNKSWLTGNTERSSANILLKHLWVKFMHAWFCLMPHISQSKVNEIPSWNKTCKHSIDLFTHLRH